MTVRTLQGPRIVAYRRDRLGIRSALEVVNRGFYVFALDLALNFAVLVWLRLQVFAVAIDEHE